MNQFSLRAFEGVHWVLYDTPRIYDAYWSKTGVLVPCTAAFAEVGKDKGGTTDVRVPSE
jgi:hypothetical protein